MRLKLLTMDVRYEHDVVLARQRARTISASLKFDVQDQTRIATAVSEIVRNCLRIRRRWLRRISSRKWPAKNVLDFYSRQRPRHSQSR